MQTFLPHRSFRRSVKVLDRARLGKQRVEAYQILRTLLELGTGWQHHPAVKMWRGHERALALYALAACEEWTSRGYVDTVAEKVRALVVDQGGWGWPREFDAAFRLSHQSNLVRKDPTYYHFDVRPDLAYVWPRGD